MTYRLTQDAKEDLRRIYLRGLNEFGEDQADAYFYRLILRFEQIAETPLKYPSVDVIRVGYRRALMGNESIYYWMDEGTAEITAILGRQDHYKQMRQS